MYKIKNLKYFLAIVASSIFMLCAVVPASAVEFPYRIDYPGIPTINSEALAKGHTAGDIVIVDVRSEIEYEVIHPKGAIHIPISNRNFIKKIKKLRSNNPGKQIAFYCNGVTCLKSYKATQKAVEAGLDNCFAYDAGIPIWASLYPQNTELLGKTLVNPEKQLIPKSKFKQKCLVFDDFTSRLEKEDGLAIDVRDHIQRAAKLEGVKKAKAIPLDKFIPNFVLKKAHQDKPLFIFDQVGKQVRWLEYYLVENGYTEYYFLAGGATSILKTQKYKN